MAELSAALQNGDAQITLAVLVLAVAFFISGVIAPELVGLLSLALLMIGGVLTPLQALAGFGSPALITLMGLFAVSAALFRSGALDRLREQIASDRIRSPRRLIALLGLVVAPVSGVVPNTPVVATLLPVLEAWCRRRRVAPSRVLLPLSFATLLGGTLTLLGSSVNLLASDISEQLGYGPLQLFSFTSIGIPVWLTGVAYMLLAPRGLLPDRGLEANSLTPDQNLEGYFTEVTIPGSSSLVGQTLRHIRLQRRFDVDVLELQREGERLMPPLADRQLEAGDRLLLRITRDDLLRLQQDKTVLLAADSLAHPPAEGGQTMVEVLSDVAKKFQNNGFRANCDLRNEKIGFKIRDHSIQRVPFIVVVGEKEKQSSTVSVRDRDGEDLGVMSIDESMDLFHSKNISRKI